MVDPIETQASEDRRRGCGDGRGAVSARAAGRERRKPDASTREGMSASAMRRPARASRCCSSRAEG